MINVFSMIFLGEKQFKKIFRAVSGLTRNKVEATEISHMPPAHTHTQPPYYEHPPPEWCICYN